MLSRFAFRPLFHFRNHCRRGNAQRIGKAENGEQGGLLPSGLQMGDERAIQIAVGGQLFLRELPLVTQPAQDFAECCSYIYFHRVKVSGAIKGSCCLESTEWIN